MRLINGNIWQYELDYICVTTNSIIKPNGRLVMGAGFAKDAASKVKNLDYHFGKEIIKKGANSQIYGLVAVGKYIAFQTKIHFKDKSPLPVVEKSCTMLKRLAEKYPDKTFGLVFPAINNGGRSKEEIMPLLEILPDNVFVFEL